LRWAGGHERYLVSDRPVSSQAGIAFIPKALKKVDGAGKQVELADGSKLDYDFLILATGPKPAFDEIEGLDPAQG
jgi:NADH dehydrogenase FAD-containing subunit